MNPVIGLVISHVSLAVIGAALDWIVDRPLLAVVIIGLSMAAGPCAMLWAEDREIDRREAADDEHRTSNIERSTSNIETAWMLLPNGEEQG